MRTFIVVGIGSLFAAGAVFVFITSGKLAPQTLAFSPSPPSLAAVVPNIPQALPSEEPPAHDDRVSLNVTDKPLKDVLDALHRSSGVKVVLSDAIPDTLISVQLEDYPLEQALKHLLAAHDSFFLFSPSPASFLGNDGARLTAVWVYPKGQGQGLYPIPAAIEADSYNLIADAYDPDTNKRAWALASLAERPGTDAAGLLQMALADPAERVRIEVVQSLLHAPVELPVDTLKELARYDASATLRAIALAGLVNRAEEGVIEPAEIQETLALAQADPDAAVAELAARVIASWDPAAEPDSATMQQTEEDPQRMYQ